MSIVYISWKDAPGWVKEKLEEHVLRFKSIPVEIGTEPSVGGYDMCNLYFYNGVDVVELKGATKQAPWETPVANAIAAGRKIKLERPECMVLQIYYFMGKPFCRLFVHPEAVAKGLEEHKNLTIVQQAILIATRAYKSSYGSEKDFRYYELGKSYGITPQDWHREKQVLVAGGYLSARGSLTLKGKNVAVNLNEQELRKELKGGRNATGSEK